MRKHKVLVTTFVTLFALGVIGVAQAWAQNGVISFRDACNDRAYVMRGEAESASNPRVIVPLPSPPNGSWGRVPLDISTSGPVTVLLFGLDIATLKRTLAYIGAKNVARLARIRSSRSISSKSDMSSP